MIVIDRKKHNGTEETRIENTHKKPDETVKRKIERKKKLVKTNPV